MNYWTYNTDGSLQAVGAGPTLPANGTTVTPPPYDPTSQIPVFANGTWTAQTLIGTVAYAKLVAQATAQLESAVQNLLDDCARRKGYDSALSCVSYQGDANFGSDAGSMKVWRSNVWAWCYAQEAAFTSGSSIPDPATFVASLLAAYPAPW